MDMGKLLGGLLKSQASGGGGLESILGGLLGGGQSHSSAAPEQPKARQPEPRRPEPRRETSHRRTSGFDKTARDVFDRYERRAEPPSELEDEQYAMLIRAMLNAAKSDGRLDRQEQEAIFSKLGDVTDEEVQFLRDEAAKQVDVREFAWSVPLGLEEQVYGFSVMAIGLDERKEADYLKELAHGLRLAPDVCNSLHDRVNAPRLF